MKVTFGKISISQGVHLLAETPRKVWLENEEGEGMAIDEKVLWDALEDFFNKHF